MLNVGASSPIVHTYVKVILNRSLVVLKLFLILRNEVALTHFKSDYVTEA